jgi:hypothetical protein
MVIVTVREKRQRQRQARTMSFAGDDVARAVALLLLLLYGDQDLDAPVDSPGIHRRTLLRATLLPRGLVITVHLQGELFGSGA